MVKKDRSRVFLDFNPPAHILKSVLAARFLVRVSEHVPSDLSRCILPQITRFYPHLCATQLNADNSTLRLSVFHELTDDNVTSSSDAGNVRTFRSLRTGFLTIENSHYLSICGKLNKPPLYVQMKHQLFSRLGARISYLYCYLLLLWLLISA